MGDLPIVVAAKEAARCKIMGRAREDFSALSYLTGKKSARPAACQVDDAGLLVRSVETGCRRRSWANGGAVRGASRSLILRRRIWAVSPS